MNPYEKPFNNICAVCGKDSIVMIPNYRNKKKRFPDYMQCKNCGAKYSIDWTKNNGRPEPLYIDVGCLLNMVLNKKYLNKL